MLSTILEPCVDIIPNYKSCFTVLFEDSLDMDFDYEDLVLNGCYTVHRTIEGIKKIIVDFHMVCRGAAFNHTFGIKIDGISSQTGSWSVKTLLSGETLKNVNNDIMGYLNVNDTTFNGDCLPIFVSTINYLVPDYIVNDYSANVFDRTAEIKEWIHPSSARCVLTFDTPFMKNNLKILPYIDVWKNQSTTNDTEIRYKIVLGDKVGYSRKGFTHYPRALMIANDFSTGPDHTVSMKEIYPELDTWVHTYPDFSDIRTYAITKPAWTDTVSDINKPTRYKSDEYTEMSVNERPLDKKCFEMLQCVSTLRFGADMQISGDLMETGSNNLLTINNAVMITSTSDNIYVLKDDGTITGTDSKGDGFTDIVKIVSNNTDIVGLKTDMTLVSSTTIGSWTDILDVALCGEHIIVLNKDYTLSKSGGNILIDDWTDIVEIKSSSTYILGINVSGDVYLADTLGNSSQIWSGTKMTKVDCSSTHCLGLTENFTVLTYNLTSSVINAWEGVADISAGDSWSAVSLMSGDILTDGTVPLNVDPSLLSNSIRIHTGFNSLLAICI